MKYEAAVRDFTPGFTKDELDDLRKKINKALAAFKDQGINISIKGGIRYGNGAFSCKIEGLKEGFDSREVSAYKLNSKLYNLPPLGSKIEVGGKQFTIRGFNTRARKNKILLTGVHDGKGYHASIPQLQRAIVVS